MALIWAISRGALVQRRVELGVEVVRQEQLHSDAEHRDRDDDRAGCCERDAHPQRPAAARALRRRHRRRTYPTPRTVWISGGSPSFWRR